MHTEILAHTKGALHRAKRITTHLNQVCTNEGEGQGVRKKQVLTMLLCHDTARVADGTCAGKLYTIIHVDHSPKYEPSQPERVELARSGAIEATTRNLFQVIAH